MWPSNNSSRSNQWYHLMSPSNLYNFCLKHFCLLGLVFEIFQCLQINRPPCIFLTEIWLRESTSHSGKRRNYWIKCRLLPICHQIACKPCSTSAVNLQSNYAHADPAWFLPPICVRFCEQALLDFWHQFVNLISNNSFSTKFVAFLLILEVDSRHLAWFTFYRLRYLGCYSWS